MGARSRRTADRKEDDEQRDDTERQSVNGPQPVVRSDRDDAQDGRTGSRDDGRATVHRMPANRATGMEDGAAGASDLASPYVDYEPGPEQESLSSRYGLSVRSGQGRKVQRLEKDFGTAQVQRWVDEGMTVATMGKPRDMSAFRQRKKSRDDAVPADIERQNAASVHRNADGGDKARQAGDTGAADVVRDVVSSPGTAMDEPVQREMESKMGEDFSDVRVHTGMKAAAAADSIDARAFTVGNHVAFNSGEYQPNTESGKQVLAHELTHVRQQTAGDVSMLPAADAELEIDPDPKLEREAEETADRVTADDSRTVRRMGTDVHVQRLPDGDQEGATTVDSHSGTGATYAGLIQRQGMGQTTSEDLENIPNAEEIQDVVAAIEEEDWQTALKEFMDTEAGEKLKKKAEEKGEDLKETGKELWEKTWVKATVITGVVGTLFGMYATDTEIPDKVVNWAKKNADLSYESGSLQLSFTPEYSGVPFDPDTWGGALDVSYDIGEDSEIASTLGYTDTPKEQQYDVDLSLETGGLNLGIASELASSPEYQEDRWKIAGDAGYGGDNYEVNLEGEAEQLFGGALTLDAAMRAQYNKSPWDLSGSFEYSKGKKGNEQYKAQLDGAIQATNDLKLKMNSLYQYSQEGSMFRQQIGASYEILDDLEGNFNAAYETDFQGRQDFEISNKLKYDMERLDAYLETAHSLDEGPSIQFGLSAQF